MGIGEAIAAEAAGEGANLILFARSEVTKSKIMAMAH